MNQTASNVDRAELAKFEELAARWWDPESEFKPLHEINPLRLDFIHRRTPLKGLRVLDVGCGGGILSESMARLGANVTAIDAGAAPLAVARLHLLESGLAVNYEQSTAEEHARAHAGAYDVVTCLEMLEHVPEPASVVFACAQMVRPGGAVYFSTINRNPKSWLFAVVGAEYVLGLLPKGTHDYRKLIRPSEMDGWCRQAGLAMREITGMHYNPLSGRYWLGPGVDVNYLVYTVRDDTQ
jgi:2-polyprenyl-6-hydroxyphenyl methylase/3-demethylubiquinone-9 3-methyltransferase